MVYLTRPGYSESERTNVMTFVANARIEYNLDLSTSMVTYIMVMALGGNQGKGENNQLEMFGLFSPGYNNNGKRMGWHMHNINTASGL